MRTVLVSNTRRGQSMFLTTAHLAMSFTLLEEHIRGVNATLLLLDEVVDEVAPKEKKKPFYQTLHKHPKFMRK